MKIILILLILSLSGCVTKNYTIPVYVDGIALDIEVEVVQ